MTWSEREARGNAATADQKQADQKQRVHVPEPRRTAPAGRCYQRDGRRTSGQPLRAAWDPLATHGPRARSVRAGGQRSQPGLRRFLRDYGWRVYALPVLVVLSALTVVNVTRQSVQEAAPTAGNAEPPRSVVATAATPTPLVPNPDAPKFAEAKASAELPGGGTFTERAAGTWTVLPGGGPQFGTGELFTYTIEIEDGVQLPGGPAGLLQVVDSTLANPKSWIGSGEYAFRRVDSAERNPDVRISLAAQATARELCGFRIPFDASCWSRGRVVLSTARWERGAVAFQGNVVAYQQYVVNHEVGHALGFSHKPCSENGGLAPIMMQQTFGVANDYLVALGSDNVVADGKVCLPNSWPYPTQ